MRSKSRSQSMRGFSLIEVMVVVALVGIMAAIAGPRLLPEVYKAQLGNSTEQVAAFMARARTEAMLSKRCVRVTIPTTTTMLMERLNSFDCDVDPLNATIDTGVPLTGYIDSTASLWIQVATLNLNVTSNESPLVALSFLQAPKGTRTGGPGDTAGLVNIRFRPSGRVWSADTTLTNDDALFKVTHSKLPATSNFKRVLVDGNGLICVESPRTPLTQSGSSPDIDYTCP